MPLYRWETPVGFVLNPIAWLHSTFQHASTQMRSSSRLLNTTLTYKFGEGKERTTIPVQIVLWYQVLPLKQMYFFSRLSWPKQNMQQAQKEASDHQKDPAFTNVSAPFPWHSHGEYPPWSWLPGVFLVLCRRTDSFFLKERFLFSLSHKFCCNLYLPDNHPGLGKVNSTQLVHHVLSSPHCTLRTTMLI